MDWIKGFFIPIIELLLVGGVIFVIAFYIGRGINYRCKRIWKFTLKYVILKQQYNIEMTRAAYIAINNNMPLSKFRAKLLLELQDLNIVNEACYIYQKLNKLMKGGK
jgi:hypothetical protein